MYVYPSGAACAVTSAAMLPLAPARLSTTTFCPTASESGAANWRATKSRPPPAPDATVQRIGLLGQAVPCAAACDAATINIAATTAPSRLRDRFISPPRFLVRRPDAHGVRAL